MVEADGERPAADPVADPELDAKIAEALLSAVPHNRALGMRFFEAKNGRVTMVLPYDPKLVGNPLTGVIHGGVITTLMDSTCGIAVYAKLREPTPIATLDLRIDYLKPAVPDTDTYAEAECIKVTRSVAFVRCETFHRGAVRDIIAVANGTFIISRGQSFRRRRPR